MPGETPADPGHQLLNQSARLLAANRERRQRLNRVFERARAALDQAEIALEQALSARAFSETALRGARDRRLPDAESRSAPGELA
jgi:hypothetical protein